MPNQQGRVTGIEPKQTAKGKTYYRVQVNGMWLSTWEKPEFNDGDEITFDIVQKGDFKNLANAAVVEGTSRPVAGTTVRSTRPNGSFDSDREARILRQNAFTSASSLVGSLIEAQGPKGNWDLRKAFDASVRLAQDIFQVNMYGYEGLPQAKAKETASAAPAGGADELFKY